MCIRDRNIPVPLYYQLKKFMLEHIDNGDLKEGDPVPSEEELCNMLHVSRATIRQARCVSETAVLFSR